MERNPKVIVKKILCEMVDDLPLDWEEIDPDNPIPATEELQPGDVPVGELSREEKVLWSILYQIGKKMMLARDRDNEKLYKLLSLAGETLRPALYFSCFSRVNDKELDWREIASIGVASGYKIFIRPRNPLIEMLAGELMGARIIIIGGNEGGSEGGFEPPVGNA